MGIKSDKAVYESSTVRAPKHQGCNNVRNIGHNNNFTLTSIYGNNSSDTQMNNDFRIEKCNIDTFSINQDHQRNARPHKKEDNADLIIFHQNIRGLYNKGDELLNLWTIEFPHIICLTEHHLRDHEISSTCIKYYNLEVKYCRKSHKYNGVSIFVREVLLFSTVELDGFYRDQDLEVCAMKLHISSFVFCILCVYRPPTGNFSCFLSF
jgi:hypothetical protein